jgi:hypothetical protein
MTPSSSMVEMPFLKVCKSPPFTSEHEVSMLTVFARSYHRTRVNEFL